MPKLSQAQRKSVLSEIYANEQVDDEDCRENIEDFKDMLSRKASFSLGVSGSLSVSVESAVNVPIADSFSKSCDPYVQMKLLDGLDVPKLDTTCPLTREVCDAHRARDSHAVQRTRCIKKTLNPTWNQDFTFLVDDRASSVLYLELIDHDFLTPDDKLAFCYVPLAALKHGEPRDVRLRLVSQDPKKYNVDDTHLHVRMRFVSKSVAVPHCEFGTTFCE